MNARLLIVLLWLAQPALGQGFAGLGTDAEGFAVPARETRLQFPQDHAAHPDFRIEWWYVTANLTGEDGRAYGVQWTLFRSALAPQRVQGWDSPQVWLGHVGLTTPKRHFVAERLARDGVGQAGAEASPFDVWIDDWQMAGQGIAAPRLRAAGADFAYDLSLRAEGPLVLHGDAGYSVKSASGQASYYYSQPFYRASGTLTLPEGEVAVTGTAWLDREWSSQPLDRDQQGWDWVSLSFADGSKLMGFQLRQADGSTFTSGTWIAADGGASPFGDGVLTMTPLQQHQVAGRSLPVEWRVAVPSRGVDVIVSALNPDSWMATSVPYWEGPVVIEGSHDGRGYLEMTGY